MPYDAHPNSELTKLDRALLVAAAVVERYESTPFEAEAVRIFEQIEGEHASQMRRTGAKLRALSLLTIKPPVL